MEKIKLLSVLWYWIRILSTAGARALNFGKAKLLTGAVLAVLAFAVQRTVFQLPTTIKVLSSLGIGYFGLLVVSLVWYIIRTPADLDTEQGDRTSKLKAELAGFQFNPVQRERRQPLLDRLTTIQRELDAFEQKVPNLMADENELAKLSAGRDIEALATRIVETRTAAYREFEHVVRETKLCFEIGAGFSTEIARLRGEFTSAGSIDINIGTPPRTVPHRCEVVRTYIHAFMDQLTVNRERLAADHR